MALVKCKECGSEISNKASACPRCGAKIRRTSGCAWLVLILFGLLIIPPMFSGFNAANSSPEVRTASPTAQKPSATPNSNAIRVSTTPQPVKSTITDPVETLSPSKEPENWSYKHSDYEMSKGRIHWAFTDSTNTVNFRFPYSSPQHGTLILRIHPKSGKNVALLIEQGQLLVRSYEDSYALVRFDDGDPINFRVVGAEDHSTTEAFFRDYQGFVNKMLKAKRVRISVPVYREGSPVFEFDVSGFDTDAYLEKKNKG
jgi:hypothetical protein